MNNSLHTVKTISRGQVWMANLGEGSGSVQGEIRPVLIVSNNKNNIYSPTVTIVPLTSKDKKSIPTHVLLNEYYLPKVSIALVEQIQCVDKGVLMKYMGRANENIMIEIDEAIKIQTDLRKEFNYDKAYEMLTQYYSVKKAIKKIEDDKKMDSNTKKCLKNLLEPDMKINLKNLKEYCDSYRMDINKINKQYKEALNSQLAK